MPVASDWRSSAKYEYLNQLDKAELAWEFLRRNPDYQRDYRTTIRRKPDDEGETEASPQRWGLRFRDRSEAGWRSITLVLVAASRSRCRSADRGARLIQ